jgi:hypothetical protein
MTAVAFRMHVGRLLSKSGFSRANDVVLAVLRDDAKDRERAR